MDEITTVGLDLAKNVFQVHGIDDEGKILVRKRLRRADVVPFFEQLPRCLVGLEVWHRQRAGCRRCRIGDQTWHQCFCLLAVWRPHRRHRANDIAALGRFQPDRGPHKR